MENTFTLLSRCALIFANMAVVFGNTDKFRDVFFYLLVIFSLVITIADHLEFKKIDDENYAEDPFVIFIKDKYPAVSFLQTWVFNSLNWIFFLVTLWRLLILRYGPSWLAIPCLVFYICIVIFLAYTDDQEEYDEDDEWD
jgi:hypothetical protein